MVNGVKRSPAGASGGSGASTVSGRCLVVMYHYVRPRTTGPTAGIKGLTPEEFRHQLQHLCQFLQPISWPEYYAAHRLGAMPVDSFLLTFDDGLHDHARYVLPILEEFGIRGLFFVPGRVLRTADMLTAHAAHILLSALGERRFTEEVSAWLDEIHPRATALTPAQREEALRLYHYEPAPLAICKYLLHFKAARATATSIVREMFDQNIGDRQAWSREWYLGWNDLEAIHSLGHTIGGHGFAHQPFLQMSVEERASDIRASAAVLDEGLGVEPRPMSYPLGSVDTATVELARSAGFVQGFTTRHAWSEVTDDAMHLPRIDTIFADKEIDREVPSA